MLTGEMLSRKASEQPPFCLLEPFYPNMSEFLTLLCKALIGEIVWGWLYGETDVVVRCMF